MVTVSATRPCLSVVQNRTDGITLHDFETSRPPPGSSLFIRRQPDRAGAFYWQKASASLNILVSIYFTYSYCVYMIFYLQYCHRSANWRHASCLPLHTLPGRLILEGTPDFRSVAAGGQRQSPGRGRQIVQGAVFVACCASAGQACYSDRSRECAEISCRIPVNLRRPCNVNSPMDRYRGRVFPSLCRPTTLRPIPMICASPPAM